MTDDHEDSWRGRPAGCPKGLGGWLARATHDGCSSGDPIGSPPRRSQRGRLAAAAASCCRHAAAAGLPARPEAAVLSAPCVAGRGNQAGSSVARTAAGGLLKRRSLRARHEAGLDADLPSHRLGVRNVVRVAGALDWIVVAVGRRRLSARAAAYGFPAERCEGSLRSHAGGNRFACSIGDVRVTEVVVTKTAGRQRSRGSRRD